MRYELRVSTFAANGGPHVFTEHSDSDRLERIQNGDVQFAAPMELLWSSGSDGGLIVLLVHAGETRAIS